MTVTAMIAEDEALLAANLNSELKALWPELQIVASVADGQSAVDEALRLQPDILFLDIRMPKMTGLEAAQALVEDWHTGEKEFPLLVFVTAYDQYAIQAFERAAFDYLLKPVESARLAASCARLRQRLKTRVLPRSDSGALDDVVRQIRELLTSKTSDASSNATDRSAPDRLTMIQVSMGSTITMVPVEQVLFFEASDKYVRVVTAQNSHLIRMSLRELMERLDPAIFWQIHRSAVVRCDAIASANRDESGKLTLTLHEHAERLSVSRMYADHFRGM